MRHQLRGHSELAWGCAALTTSVTCRLQVLRVLRHCKLLQGADELGPQGWGDHHKAHSRAGTCRVPPALALALLSHSSAQVALLTRQDSRMRSVAHHLFVEHMLYHTMQLAARHFENAHVQKAMPVRLCACNRDAASLASRMRHGMHISRRTRCRGIRR